VLPTLGNYKLCRTRAWRRTVSSMHRSAGRPLRHRQARQRAAPGQLARRAPRDRRRARRVAQAHVTRAGCGSPASTRFHDPSRTSSSCPLAS
jgi:hypothetical protein